MSENYHQPDYSNNPCGQFEKEGEDNKSKSYCRNHFEKQYPDMQIEPDGKIDNSKFHNYQPYTPCDQKASCVCKVIPVLHRYER